MKPGHRFSPRRPPAMDMIPQGWSLIGRPLLLRLIATVQGWKKEDWPSVNRTVVHVFGGLRISQPLVVKRIWPPVQYGCSRVYWSEGSVWHYTKSRFTYTGNNRANSRCSGTSLTKTPVRLLPPLASRRCISCHGKGSARICRVCIWWASP